MNNQMNKKMTELQKILDTKNITEFKVWDYKEYTLKIVASFDFAYYHNVEIVFYGVSFVSCATRLIESKIRLGTNEERNRILMNHRIDYMEEEDILFCFSVRNGYDKYYVLAEKFDFIVNDVLY